MFPKYSHSVIHLPTFYQHNYKFNEEKKKQLVQSKNLSQNLTFCLKDLKLQETIIHIVLSNNISFENFLHHFHKILARLCNTGIKTNHS